MRARKVSIIGGGPAGLFAARLLRLRHPDWEVDVYEKLPPDETFGFGVGLTGGVLTALAAVDPVVHDDLRAASINSSTGEFRLPSGTAVIPGFHRGTSIARARLLQVLAARARQAGARVHVGAVVGLDDVQSDTDLVIAADGVSSATRQQLADEVGASVTLGRGLYIWCGADVMLPGAVFTPVWTDDGVFVTHAYPYAEGRSTFVIETDEQTWQQAGFDRTGDLGPGESDAAAVTYLTRAFSPLLEGQPLIGNASRWLRFRSVVCKRWHHDNVVLIGDAAHTAHPSLGSGTKMALEDAIALCDALGSEADIETALPRYEDVRRPFVEYLQDRARRSQLWWESFPTRLDLPPAQIAVAFLSRAGAVSVDDLAKSEPQFVRPAVAAAAGVEVDAVPHSGLTTWMLEQPVTVGDRRLRNRLVGDGVLGIEPAVIPGRDYVEIPTADPAAVTAARAGSPNAVVVGRISITFDDPWGPEATDLIDTVRALRDAGADSVHLTGPLTRGAVLDRLALGERVRREVGVVVVVEGPPSHVIDLVDGLVAGRTDLVAVPDGTTR